MTRAVVGASPGYPCHCLVSSQLISSHLKCYIIELSNLGLCWPKLTIMSSLHYKSTSRLHYIFMFISIKLSKPKGPFQNIALGWSILCLAKMTQLLRCHLNQGALPASHLCPLLHWWWPAPKMPSSCLACLATGFFHATQFLFLCLTPSTRTGFAHNLKCGAKMASQMDWADLIMG